jgi:hypothetical protein
VQNVIFVLGPWINPTDLVAPSPGPQWPPHLRLSRPPHFLISLTINLWRYSRDSFGRDQLAADETIPSRNARPRRCRGPLSAWRSTEADMSLVQHRCHS